MTDHIDPQATGAWDITTYSGARYRLSVPADRRATVVRQPAPAAPARHGPRHRPVRRDETPVEVVEWGTWDQLIGLLPGIAVGQCMVLILEPLASSGDATTRITTPVAAIRPLDPPDIPAGSR